jgi:hypothetical protein
MSPAYLKEITLNVPAVNDVFAVAIKELRSNSSNCKNVAEKKTTKGASPTGFFRSLAARTGRRTFTVLLCDGKTTTKRPPRMAGVSIMPILPSFCFLKP